MNNGGGSGLSHSIPEFQFQLRLLQTQVNNKVRLARRLLVQLGHYSSRLFLAQSNAHFLLE